MSPESERLKKLKQKHADLQLRIRQEQQKLVREERRKDTRRKILAGTEALAEAERNPEWGQRLRSRLDEVLTHNRDRALFDLPPREGS